MGCPRTWGTKFASPAQLTHVCHQSCRAYNFKQQMRRWMDKDIGMGAYNSVFSILCLRGGRYTISEFEFCARVRGHQQLPFLNFVPAYALRKSLKNIRKTSYLDHAWNTNTSRNIAEFQKGKGLAPYLLSPRCALIAHRASPSGFSHFPMGAKRKSWCLIREARRERRM